MSFEEWAADRVMSCMEKEFAKDAWNDSAKAERQACASIVEGTAKFAHEGTPEKAHQAFMLDNCAIAIRMRPNVELTGAARLYRAASSDRRERG